MPIKALVTIYITAKVYINFGVKAFIVVVFQQSTDSLNHMWKPLQVSKANWTISLKR